MFWLGLWILAIPLVSALVVVLIVLVVSKLDTLPDDSWKDSLARTKGELPHGYPYKKKGKG